MSDVSPHLRLYERLPQTERVPSDVKTMFLQIDHAAVLPDECMPESGIREYAVTGQSGGS